MIRSLDPGHDRDCQLIPGGPSAAVEDVPLNQSEEALHNSVIAGLISRRQESAVGGHAELPAGDRRWSLTPIAQLPPAGTFPVHDRLALTPWRETASASQISPRCRQTQPDVAWTRPSVIPEICSVTKRDSGPTQHRVLSTASLEGRTTDSGPHTRCPDGGRPRRSLCPEGAAGRVTRMTPQVGTTLGHHRAILPSAYGHFPLAPDSQPSDDSHATPSLAPSPAART